MKRLVAAILLFSVLSGQGVFAFADSDGLEVFDMSLAELLAVEVSTVSKFTESIADSPANITVFTAEQIRQRGLKSLAELLKTIPGIHYSHFTVSDLYNSINFRGSSGNNKFLILLDGVRVSSAAGEGFPIGYNFPLYYAKQVEVLMGPSSVVYGADAFMGVVNIITKDQEESDATEVEFSSGTDDYHYGHGFLNQTVAEQWNINLGVSAHRSADFRPADDFPELYPAGGVNSPYDFAPVKDYDLLAQLEKGGWQAGLKYSELQNNTYYANTPATAGFNPDAQTQTELFTLFGRYRDWLTNELHSSTLLTFMRYELDNSTAFNHTFSNFQMEYKYAESERYSIQQDFIYDLNEEHRLSFGFLYEYFDILPIGSNFEQPYDTGRDPGEQVLYYPGTTSTPGAPPLRIQLIEDTQENGGLYLQDAWQLAEQWRLVAGVRYDYNSRYGEVTTPRASLVYRPTEKSSFKLLYGESYLAPSPDDTYRFWGSFSFYDGSNWVSFFAQVPNVDLEPEKARTLELSCEHHFSKSLYLKVAPYITRIDDVIYTVEDAVPEQAIAGADLRLTRRKKNIGESEVRGVDLGLESKVIVLGRPCKGWGSLSYADGKVDDGSTEKDMPFLHRWSLKGGVTAEVTDRWLVSSLVYWLSDGTSNYTNLAVNLESESYFVMDLHSELELGKGLTLLVDVHNLFDEAYFQPTSGNSNYIFSEGAPQPGRLLALGLRASF